jgi:nitroreductase
MSLSARFVAVIGHSANCAPIGGTMQRWRFLMIRDPKDKHTVGAFYQRAWDEGIGAVSRLPE